MAVGKIARASRFPHKYHYVFAEIQTDEKQRQSGQQDVERDFERCHVLQDRPVDSDDIKSVREGRCEYHDRSGQVQGRSVSVPVEQSDAAERQ